MESREKWKAFRVLGCVLNKRSLQPCTSCNVTYNTFRHNSFQRKFNRRNDVVTGNNDGPRYLRRGRIEFREERAFVSRAQDGSSTDGSDDISRGDRGRFARGRKRNEGLQRFGAKSGVEEW